MRQKNIQISNLSKMTDVSFITDTKRYTGKTILKTSIPYHNIVMVDILR